MQCFNGQKVLCSCVAVHLIHSLMVHLYLNHVQKQVTSVEERMALLGEAPLPSTAAAQHALASAAALSQQQQVPKQVGVCLCACIRPFTACCMHWPLLQLCLSNSRSLSR